MNKYKISDEPLKLREYGRNVQGLVDYMRTVDSRDQRNWAAGEIVRIMSCLNPALKDNEDYWQKLWDHLALIGEYELDIDAPYELPTKEVKAEKVEPMGYYRGRPRFRQYGKNIDLMIQKAIEMEEGEVKTAYVNLIANTMRQALHNIDRDSTAEIVISEHIKEISRGKLIIEPDSIVFVKVSTQNQHPHHFRNHSSAYISTNNKKKKRKKRNNNHKRKNYH
ncbi:MAG: DUF4290 domain-containing protein [Bacteroidota bacterium]